MCTFDLHLQLIEFNYLLQFSDLRHELLEREQNVTIVHTYGLLMLLPQCEAFHTLRRRLECVAHLRPYQPWTDKRVQVQAIDFRKLTEHFIQLQEKHRSFRQINLMLKRKMRMKKMAMKRKMVRII